MKQTTLEQLLVLDAQAERTARMFGVALVPTSAARWRQEHVKALARAADEEEARKRRRAKQMLWSIPVLWSGVRL